MRFLIITLFLVSVVFTAISCASTDPQKGNYEKLDLFHQQKQVR